MKISKLNRCDVYRDGGSLGLVFEGDDGKQYELLVKSRHLAKRIRQETGPDYSEPVIYLDRRHSGNIVQRLDWEAAQSLIQGHRFSASSEVTSARNYAERLAQLIEIIGLNRTDVR